MKVLWLNGIYISVTDEVFSLSTVRENAKQRYKGIMTVFTNTWKE